MKPYQQISLNFGFDEPPAPEISVILDQEIPRSAGSETPIDSTEAEAAVNTVSETPRPQEVVSVTEKRKKPERIAVIDERTVLTIRKKPGRKEKEKVWKSATPGKRGRKSLKDIASEADLIEIPADEQLFSKQYYSIGDVANMFRMNPSLIRTWSNEFDGLLQPRKNRKGDRYFRPDDVKLLHLIYHLIRVRKFTLEGAKEHLKLQKKKTEKQFAVIQALQQFRSFLLELKSTL